MATKGDISGLDTLMFGGEPMVPQVSGFSRFRKSGVIQSGATGGARRQRKKFFNMPHEASATFYLETVGMMDYMQSFINDNEGKKFICHLAADNAAVEPYVVQVISEWEFTEVNAVESTVGCQLEIFSTN